MIAWRAFRNMLLTAARDPVWAIVSIVVGPFRAGKYLFGMLIATVIVLLILALGADLAGLSRGQAVVRGDPRG